MLNENKERELAYIVKVDAVDSIEGYDRIRYATVNGWHCVVGLDIQAGDLCVYFEIDSLLNKEDERFAFCGKYKYKIRNQRYCKGTKLSQGLLMPLSAFPELANKREGDFCTKELKVTYYDPMDRTRKKRTNSDIETHKVFKKLKGHFPFKQLMRTKWGRNILLSIFKVRKKKKNWPWFMPKSDEERVQNIPWMLQNKTPFILSEKIDGCSSGFTVERKKFGRLEYSVCSRNVVLSRNSETYYPSNVWFEMYDKYNIKEFLTSFIKETNADWVYLQGESFGEGIQKRDYSLKGHDFRAFSLCTSKRVRYNYVEMKDILDRYNIPTVPILNPCFYLPDSVDELLEIASGNSEIDGLPREGVVLQNIDDPTISFKAVDNKFIEKYH